MIDKFFSTFVGKMLASIFLLAIFILIFVLPIVLPIALPFVLLFFLPKQLILVYWLLALLAEWVETRITGKNSYTFLWALGACFGLSSQLAVFVNGTFAKVVVSLGCLSVLFVVLRGWHRLIGIKDEKKAKKFYACLLNRDEFVMGGPEICVYQLQDGAVILNGGVENDFSPDGRYFATLSPSSNWQLIIYDLRKQILHTCYIGSAFRNLRDVGDEFIWVSTDSNSKNEGSYFSIGTLLQSSARQKMIAVNGLKIPEDEWQQLGAPFSQPFPAPPIAGGPRLDWRPFLPNCLLDMDDPLEPLRRPVAEIVVEGEASGLMVEINDKSIIWRQDGQALVCDAYRKDGWAQGYWLLLGHKGWRYLNPPRDLAKFAPHGSKSCEARLDIGQLHLPWQLAQPELAEDSHGALASYIFASLQIGPQSFEMPLVQQVLDLETAAAGEHLESAALQNGEKLIWRFQRHDGEILRDVYECSWQGQVLPGEWLLDHRLSNDGRYLALVAYAAAPAVPHRIAVIDSQSGLLSWVEDALYFPQMQGFSDRTLHLVELAGRQAETDETAHPTDQEQGVVPAISKGLLASTTSSPFTGSPTREAPEASREWYLEDGDFTLHHVRRTVSLRGSVWRAD